MSASDPLAYATPRTDVRPPPTALFWTSAVASAIAAMGGLFFFLAYLATRREDYVVGGLVWLYVGGGLTLLAFVAGVVYAAIARLRNYPPPSTRRRGLLAILLPVANVPLAFGLAIAGMSMVSSEMSTLKLTLINPSAQRIDRVTAFTPARKTIELGSLEAGGKVVVPVHIDGEGSIQLTMSRGTQTWQQSIGYVTPMGGGTESLTLAPENADRPTTLPATGTTSRPWT